MSETVVLFVHSSTTIFLAKRLLQNQIPEASKVIVLFDRVSESDLIILPGEKINIIQTFGDRFVKLQTFEKINAEIKKFIQYKINSQFILVVPHLYYDIFQILSNSQLCKKIIYFEEGDLSYLTREDLDNRYSEPRKFFEKKAVRKLFSWNKLYEKHPFPTIKKPFETAAFNESAFSFLNCKKYYYPFNEVFTFPGYSFSNDFNNSVILLINNIDLRQWKYFPEKYIQDLKNIFAFIQVNFGSHIYIKPHPAFYRKKEKIEELTQLIYKSGLTATIINDPIELILVNFKNIKILSSESSLLRYTCYAGYRPFFLWKENVKKDSYFSRFMEDFDDQLHYI